MEGKFFLLIWVILLLGQLYGYKSCVDKERKALLELKNTVEEESDYALPTWTYDTKSDCCRWEGLKCNRTSKRVAEIAFGTLNLIENAFLNLSLLHPFENVRCLNLSSSKFHGWFDDVEGYKSLRRLRNLEILDLSYNNFNSSILPFLYSATSLTTLFLRHNYFNDIPLPAEELSALRKLKFLDLSLRDWSSSGTTISQSLSQQVIRSDTKKLFRSQECGKP